MVVPTRRTALWVVPVADLAGVARHVLDVVRAGLPGWSLVVLGPPGPLADRLAEQGAAVVADPGFGVDAGPTSSVRVLRSTIRALRPEVTHSHLAFADVVLAATPGDTLRVSTEHGIAGDRLLYQSGAVKARLKEAMHAARLRRFDRLLAVSHATADAMRAAWHVSAPITVIPNGVDPVGRPQAVPDADGVHVASISRLAPEKRIPQLLEAFALVRQREPLARLTLAGTGPLERELRATVDRLGLQDAVTMPGFVDAADLLGRADVLVQLSAWENCSYSLLDAVARGVGVVASPVGGNPELLPPRCLADPADHDAVAAAILAQAEPGPTRPSLPATVPTVAAMAARIAEVYESL